MRVLHLITGLGHGGAQNALLRLVSRADAHEHTVVSLTGAGVYGPRFETADVPLETLDLGPSRGSFGRARRLRQRIARGEFDLIQSWMYHADLASYLLTRTVGSAPPTVWGIRQALLDRRTAKVSTLAVARINAMLSHRGPTLIASCAERAVQWHGSIGYDTSRFRDTPNGIDVDLFSPDSDVRRHMRFRLGIVDDAPLIGMVARYHPLKDHMTLLRSLALLIRRTPEVRCALIGPGLEDSNLELMAMIRETGTLDHVHLLGARNNVHEFMNAFDVHVLSSHSEGFPNVVGEAMAVGVPNVVADVGDAARIVGDTGQVVSPRNDEAMAEALWRELTLERSDDRRRRARDRVVHHFTIPRMVLAFEAVWDEALSRSS